MASLNKVMLIATLGKDPEVRYTTSGTAVAGFSAATNEKFKNRNGECIGRERHYQLMNMQQEPHRSFCRLTFPIQQPRGIVMSVPK